MSADGGVGAYEFVLTSNHLRRSRRTRDLTSLRPGRAAGKSHSNRYTSKPFPALIAVTDSIFGAGHALIGRQYEAHGPIAFGEYNYALATKPADGVPARRSVYRRRRQYGLPTRWAEEHPHLRPSASSAHAKAARRRISLVLAASHDALYHASGAVRRASRRRADRHAVRTRHSGHVHALSAHPAHEALDMFAARSSNATPARPTRPDVMVTTMLLGLEK